MSYFFNEIIKFIDNNNCMSYSYFFTGMIFQFKKLLFDSFKKLIK